MTSSKPYLIRGLYQWLLDNQVTPYILADASSEDIMIPSGVATDGKVVLNLSPSAIDSLEMTNDYLSFSARFNGVAQEIYCPIASILAIYAQENGEGMMFPADTEGEPNSLNKGESSDKSQKPVKAGLKIVK